ncbi:helix-turn-helix domain-containing protein [Pantoea sp. LMR881]|uniref:ArsR/SmtB family transcription factor n=1 Tax=Pantoea sp. LMR881 TaxID=3014336 RepID=UPI0022B03946|nr:helix-turn-helix domain-containing protein [Pantoea sp. LMR881]MCZ4060781.1 helix-turn-helix domain-containing protein [Pantoea sp. LMR881]
MITNHPEAEQIRLENILFALGNPLRLDIVQTLAREGEQSCGMLRGEVAKSTMTHHWRVLRDSGVIWQRPLGRENLISLRRDDLEQRFPGLLESLLTAMTHN